MGSKTVQVIEDCLPVPGRLERDWVLWVELWLRAAREPDLRPLAASLYGRYHEWLEDVLKRMSDETGGPAYFPRGPDELLDDFHQIESELRSQYLIAYSPTNIARDGSFRRIEVRLAARPDVRVISRRGYYATSEEVKK